MTNTNEIREALATAREQVEEAKQKLETAQGILKMQRGKVIQLKRDLNAAIGQQEEKRVTNRDRAAANRIAKKYSITIENDSVWDVDGYDFRTYVPLPEWLDEDPLEDGHFAYDWAGTRWLVEFYAKHHPTHPKHSEREFLDISPWC